MVPSKATTYGEYNKSQAQWTGLIGELRRNEVDFIVTDMSILIDRAQVYFFNPDIFCS